jgi:hypothetical protein
MTFIGLFMKIFIATFFIFSTLRVMARDLVPFDNSYLLKKKEEKVVEDYNLEVKNTYLSKTLLRQQIAYEGKITTLESELKKTKERLIEKSINHEAQLETLKKQYDNETLSLKRELASKTKTMLEFQRLVEKMNPSDELKKLIKLNTELASEVRSNEDRLAIIQLKGSGAFPREKSLEHNLRMPASSTHSK